MEGPVPEPRERPTLTMAAMDMGGMDDGDMGDRKHGDMENMSEMDHSEMDHDDMSGDMNGNMGESETDGLRPPGTLPEPVMHDPGEGHGPGEAGLPMMAKSRL